jgi:hypothetical protein
LIALALVIITSSSLAEAAPINNENLDVQITVQEEVKTDPPQIEVPPVKTEPVVQPVPVVTPTAKPKQPTPKPTVTGNKETWLRESGIPESEWWAVDYIVSKESSWNPLAVNKSSGACGLAQALPCSKLGTNWSDPVHALKWQYSYVTSRYGGYQQAVAFWKINHWY